MRLTTESWAGGGRVVARAEGRVWFVAGALPGEEVEIEADRRRAGVVEAHVAAVHRASPDREPDPCPVADRCGGCDLAHVRRSAAPDTLRALVRGAFRHAPAALGAALDRAPVMASPLRSRLRARLHWRAEDGRLGFFAARSHQVVAVDPCRIVSDRLLAALPVLSAALREARCADGEVEWLESLDGGSAVAGWLGAGGPPLGPRDGIDGWWRLDAGGRGPGWGASSVVMKLPVPLTVPVGAFFQVNRHLVPRLFGRVAEVARGVVPRRTVDLYGGVGFLAAAARHGGCDALVVVEPNAVAARAAANNLPGARVLTAKAEEYLASAADGVGTLALVDAPRAGVSPAARRGLLAWRPAALLVLSCDAARFGRDAGDLLAAGYELSSMEVWDLFPGSHHAEILALFRRH